MKNNEDGHDQWKWFSESNNILVNKNTSRQDGNFCEKHWRWTWWMKMVQWIEQHIGKWESKPSVIMFRVDLALLSIALYHMNFHISMKIHGVHEGHLHFSKLVQNILIWIKQNWSFSSDENGRLRSEHSGRSDSVCKADTHCKIGKSDSDKGWHKLRRPICLSLDKSVIITPTKCLESLVHYEFLVDQIYIFDVKKDE